MTQNGRHTNVKIDLRIVATKFTLYQSGDRWHVVAFVGERPQMISTTIAICHHKHEAEDMLKNVQHSRHIISNGTEITEMTR